MKQKQPKRPSSPSHPSSWEQRFKELKEFKKEHGHCKVPFRYSLNPILGRWINTVRYAKKQGTLAKKRVHCLNALGFVWVREVSWEQRIHDLKEFKKEHGHCNVSARYQLNPALAHWVSSIRQRKKHGTLAEDGILMLDALGFVWERQTTWEEHFNSLKAFKKKHGHCKVPFRYPLNPVLGQWVNSVRQLKKQGILTKDRILLLDALGFLWMTKMRGILVPWKQRINELKAFKKKHGHCNVSGKYQPNPALAHWVANLRQRKKLGELTEDKIISLDALGFYWDRLGKQV